MDVLTDCLLGPCGRAPHATALIRGDARIRYRSLRDRIAALSSAMAAEGVESGQCVALLLDDGVDLIAHLLAVLARGASVLPLAADSGLDDVERALDSAQPSLAVASADLAPGILATLSRSARTVRVGRRGLSSVEALERAGSRPGQRLGRPGPANDPALHFFSDTATGGSHIHTLSHRAVVTAVRTCADQIPFDERSRVGVAGPLHQPPVLIGHILATLAAGGTLYLPAAADAPAPGTPISAAWARQARLTALGLPATMLVGVASSLLDAGDGALEGISTTLLWGAPLPPHSREAVGRALPGSRLVRWLGIEPDSGAVTLRGEPAAGLVDRAGTLVAPAAVEAVLRNAPWLADAAVVAVQNQPGHLLELVAFVVPEDSGSSDDATEDLEETWRAYMAERLAPLRRPDRYVVTDDLPRSPGGEPDRVTLHLQAQRLMARTKRPRSAKKRR